MANTFSSPTCKKCGGERRIRATGRPGEYCGPRCRQAANRLKKTDSADAEPPDTAQYDQALKVQLRQIIHTAQAMSTALDQPDPPPLDPLRHLVDLQVTVERMTAGTVGRTRRLGATWAQISSVLRMSKDAARRRFSPASRRPAPPRRAPLQVPAPPPPTGRDVPAAAGVTDPDCTDTTGRAALPEPAPAAPAAATPVYAQGDLAMILSQLQRASGHSLREVARRSGLSPSHMSRIVCGNRFPSWDSTASIARACGADYEVLRKVWEDSHARRGNRPSPPSLAGSLRYLHQRAGSPTAWVISITSGRDLEQDLITALLDGTATGEWEDVQRLVQLLDGEPAYFHPLWQAETAARPTPTHTPPPAPPAKQAVREDTASTATRIEDLLIAFSDALRPTGPAPTPTTRHRRYLATRIAGTSR